MKYQFHSLNGIYETSLLTIRPFLFFVMLLRLYGVTCFYYKKTNAAILDLIKFGLIFALQRHVKIKTLINNF